MTVSQLFKKAAELLRTEFEWTQGCNFRDKENNHVIGADNPDVCKCCLNGALWIAAYRILGVKGWDVRMNVFTQGNLGSATNAISEATGGR